MKQVRSFLFLLGLRNLIFWSADYVRFIPFVSREELVGVNDALCPFHRFSRSHCRDLYIGHLNSRCSFSIIWRCDLKGEISWLSEIWPIWFSIHSLIPWHSSLPAVNSDANLMSVEVPSLISFVESCIKLFFAVVLTANCMRNGYDHGTFVL